MSEVCQPIPENNELRCGTIQYTIPKLIVVFVWLFVGFFVFSVCTQLPAKMLPVQFLTHMGGGVSDTANQLIITTIGGILNITVCPYIGFVSDRKRSKWGRRIPYILYALPFISLALFLFAFTDVIGEWLVKISPWTSANPITMTLIAIGIVMFLFQFFFMYVGSVICYLANDTIPPKYFGHYSAVIQIASNAGMFLFNFFIYRHAQDMTAFRYIFIGGMILYTVGTLLMCLNIKETEYPPMEGEEELQGKSGSPLDHFRKLFSGIGIFFRESFSHRLYIYRYLLTTFQILTYGAIAAFIFFLRNDMNVEVKHMGMVDGYLNIIALVGFFLALFVLSTLVGRWHPVRIAIYTYVFGLALVILDARWLLGTLTPQVYIYSSAILAVGKLLSSTITGLAGGAFEMLTFPKSRYGSFCSMQAVIRATTVTIASVLLGLGMDWIAQRITGETFWFNHVVRGGSHYRLVVIWQVAMTIPASILSVMIYREWTKLGGYTGYKAPAIWEKSGFEEMPQPNYHAPSGSFLKLSLYGFDFICVIMVALVAFWVVYFTRIGEFAGARLYLLLAGSITLAATVVWLWVRHGIMRDLKRCLRGEAPINGIPHHGMLIFTQIIFVFSTLLTVWYTYNLPLNNGVYYLALHCLGNLVMFVLVYVVARMERGVVTWVAERPLVCAE